MDQNAVIEPPVTVVRTIEEQPAAITTTIIEARPGWKFIDLAEMWRYRELLYFLVWRDVKVRYKQTVLGALWAILQPLATMVVFSVFFGRMADMSSGPVPYPLFVFAGLLPWTFFSNAVTGAGGSVVGEQNLVTKVYFPRLFIPLGTVGAGLVDFAIAMCVLVVMMLCYGRVPGVLGTVMPALPTLILSLVTAALAVGALTLALLAAALGVGVLLSALTVAYRDFRHVVPFMVQLWLFATPCIYMRTETIGPRWNAILPLNPVFGIIKNFRAAALGEPFDWYSLGISSAVAIALLVVGSLYFRRVERSFADII
jgi:lipopolysaccharide transport system permease protein